MNKVFMFTLGAAVGSLLTWKIVENKYKKIADEEIESVKERYKSREKMIYGLTEEKVNEVEECKTLVNDLGYYDNEEVEDEEDCTVNVELGEDYIQPFVISPEEFGDMPGYDTKSWTYYSDGILTDEADEIVTDIEDVIGDALEHFGDYDDSSVYVRNDNDKCDYEILKYYRPFNNGVES